MIFFCVCVHYWEVDHLFHCRNDKVSQYNRQKCHTSRVENTDIKYFSCFQCWTSHMSSFVGGVRLIRTGHGARPVYFWWMKMWWRWGWTEVSSRIFGFDPLTVSMNTSHTYPQSNPPTYRERRVCHASLLVTTTGMSAAAKYQPHRSRSEGCCSTRIQSFLSPGLVTAREFAFSPQASRNQSMRRGPGPKDHIRNVNVSSRTQLVKTNRDRREPQTKPRTGLVRSSHGVER